MLRCTRLSFNRPAFVQIQKQLPACSHAGVHSRALIEYPHHTHSLICFVVANFMQYPYRFRLTALLFKITSNSLIFPLYPMRSCIRGHAVQANRFSYVAKNKLRAHDKINEKSKEFTFSTRKHSSEEHFFTQLCKFARSNF